MLKFILWLTTLVLFAFTAGFQVIIFWGLFRYQNIVLYDYSKFWNITEFVLAILIFLLALFALGYFVGYLIGKVKHGMSLLE